MSSATIFNDDAITRAIEHSLATNRQEQELREALRESEFREALRESEFREALRESKEHSRQEQEFREALRESKEHSRQEQEFREALRESKEHSRQEQELREVLREYFSSTLDGSVPIPGIKRNTKRDNLEEFYQTLDGIMKATIPGEEYFNQGGQNFFKNIESIPEDQYNCCGFNAVNKLMTLLPYDDKLTGIIEKIWKVRVMNDDGMIEASDLVQIFSHVGRNTINVCMTDENFPGAYIALTEFRKEQDTYIIYRRKNHYVIHSNV